MKMYVSAIAMAAALAVPAFAADSVTPVSSKIAAKHAPMGVRAGSFLVTPKASVNGTYNDNIYATDTNTESDFITSVKPEVTVESNWNRHALNAKANVEARKFSDNTAENETNHFVGADGRIDIMRDTAIGGGISWNRNHEDRGNPNSVSAAKEPTRMDTLTGKLGAYRSLGRLSGQIETQAERKTFEDGRNAISNAVIDNGGRNRNEYTQSARVGYDLDDRFEVFAKGTVDARVYDRDLTLNRSSHGKTAVVGTAFDITGKTAGEAYVGHMSRNYVHGTIKDIDGVNFGGKVTWNPSQITTIIGNIERSIDETVSAVSSGYVNTDYGIKAEHALTEHTLLTGNVGYTNHDYQGTGINQRDDDYVTFGAGAKHYINRYLAANAGYTFRDRDSSVAGADYDRNTIMVGLSAQY